MSSWSKHIAAYCTQQYTNPMADRLETAAAIGAGWTLVELHISGLVTGP